MLGEPRATECHPQTWRLHRFLPALVNISISPDKHKALEQSKLLLDDWIFSVSLCFGFRVCGPLCLSYEKPTIFLLSLSNGYGLNAFSHHLCKALPIFDRNIAVTICQAFSSKGKFISKEFETGNSNSSRTVNSWADFVAAAL